MRNNNLLLALCLLLIALFFLLPMWQIGLFDDGVFYGCISRNLAEVPTSYGWDLVVSPTLDPQFNGHPPFMFWAQSCFFRLLGDYFWVEKLFSFSCLLLCIGAIRSLWNLYLPAFKMYAYLPVLFWLLLPINWWSFGNNMLENLLTGLDLWAVFFISRHLLAGRWWGAGLLVAAGLLAMAALTKGPVGLFPLALPAVFWLFSPKAHFLKNSLTGLFLLGFLLLFFALLIKLDPRAGQFLARYVDLQLAPSLAGNAAATSRWLILQKIVEENILAGLLLVGLFGYKKITHCATEAVQWVEFKLFITLALCASLPIMVSPKQLGFYVVPSLAYFALAWAVLALPVLGYWRKRQGDISRWLAGLYLLAAGLSLFGLLQYGSFGRNKDILHDVFLLNQKIPAHTVVRLENELYKQWNLHGYCYRFGHINLLCDDSRPYRFWLTGKNSDNVPAGFQKSVPNTKLYQLWEKIDSIR